jgi:hypothetical protein
MNKGEEIRDKFQLELQTKLREWVEYDNQQQVLNEKLNEIRAKKKDISEEIFELTNNTDIKVKMNEEKIHITKTNVQQPLTFKYLQSSLSNIIKNESQLEQTMRYIKENREVKVVSEIKRILPK